MRWLVLIWVCLAPVAVLAEEDGKGRLTKFLESALSGTGRDVEVTGFQGALSSHASIEKIVISDAKGPWLTMSGIELIWTRSALLQGRVEVEKLVAAKIELDRLPQSEPTPPSPEAGAFSLPELPVSINIAELNAGHVVLGQPVFGQPLEVSVLGKLALVDGDGDARLDLVRTDGTQGHVRFSGGFSNQDRTLSVDLDVTEESHGIFATLLSLPGAPSLHFSVAGTGPLDEYVANLRLATLGQERLQGVVATSLQTELDDNGVEIGQTRIVGVDIAGDMSPLFAPEFSDFFGPNVSLTSVLRRPSDNRTYLDQLLISARSFQARGEMVLLPGGLPERMALDIDLADPDGGRIRLPATSEISLTDGNVTLRYDAENSDRWSLRGHLRELDLPDLSVASTTLDGTGAIRHGDVSDLSADISLKAIGLTGTNPENTKVADALGDFARLATRFSWRSNEPFKVSALTFETEESRVLASGEISGPTSALTVSGRMDAKIDDLAFIEPFVDTPISGSVDARLSGTGQPLNGAFDIVLDATASNLLTGETTIDALTGDVSTLNLSVMRNQDGFDLRQMKLRSEAVSLDASGSLKTGEGSVSFSADLDDLQRILPNISGPVSISGTANESPEAWAADIRATAPGRTTATATFDMPKSSGGNLAVEVAIGQIKAWVPTLSGNASLSLNAEKTKDGWEIDSTSAGSSVFALEAQGLVHDDLQSGDLRVSGRVPLELANSLTKAASLQGSASFDFALDGPFALPSLSGTVETSGTRLTLPDLRMSFADIAARADIRGTKATLSLDSAVTTGGRLGVSGTIALQAPFTSNLAVSLNNTRLRHEDLLETELLGKIQISGPLTGGAKISGEIELEHTEINVAGSSLGGGSSVPEITHIGQPNGVYRTRKFAGALPDTTNGGSSSSPFLLDLTIRANNKVFVRGLGLDAEFQGAFDLSGPTDAIVTSGEFELSRGRLDFLTKRLDLTEGLVRLEGDFVPFLKMVAETETSDASFEIILEGRASSPDFQIKSSPDMPDEEALSLILFGQSIENISAIQAAQLAGAVASLRGQGGTGFVGGIRKSFGLDNLDITTNDEGTAGLSAGKHLNEKLYTEIGVDGKGESSISLNFDVSPKFTVKGRLDSNSDTGVGFFFKHDY